MYKRALLHPSLDPLNDYHSVMSKSTIHTHVPEREGENRGHCREGLHTRYIHICSGGNGSGAAQTRALGRVCARSRRCAVRVMEETRWETCICHWHIVKDCGLACCCQACLGLPCILGAAMERAGLGGCFPWCSASCCCPCCTGCNARAQIAKKYGIEEGAPMSCIYACCCPFFSEIQIINQVHVRTPQPPQTISCLLPDIPLWSKLANFIHRFITPPTATLLTKRFLRNVHRF